MLAPSCVQGKECHRLVVSSVVGGGEREGESEQAKDLPPIDDDSVPLVAAVDSVDVVAPAVNCALGAESRPGNSTAVVALLEFERSAPWTVLGGTLSATPVGVMRRVAWSAPSHGTHQVSMHVHAAVNSMLCTNL